MKQSMTSWLFERLKSLLRILLVILIAFAINAIVLVITGKSVKDVYLSLWKGAFSDGYNIARTVRWAIPLMFTALAFIVSSRTGVFNCGAEGQLLVGALAAAVVSFTFTSLPGWLLILLSCLAAMLAGIIWSVIGGIISIRFNANVIVVTLMLNYIATLLTEYFTRHTFNEGGALSHAGSTAYTAEQSNLTTLFSGTQVTTALIIGLVVCVLVFIYANYTQKGYETRIIGMNERFARFSGLNVNRGKLTSFILCGAIAGLGGAMETLGIYHRFLIGAIEGFGFDGIVVALLARNNPLMVPVAALFMGALTSGSITVEMFGGVPKSMTDILMGFIIIMITIQKCDVKNLWSSIKNLFHKKSERVS